MGILRPNKRWLPILLMNCFLIVYVGTSCVADDGSKTEVDEKPFQEAASVEEARSRAYLLHETIHDLLHVVHRDFFDADESIKIPSHSFEDVFAGLKRGYGVQLHWLAVDARAMNVDNEPKTEFERNAVKVLSKGKKRFENVDMGSYRFAGRIHLPSQCLKCHLPSRSSNTPRSAGLVITIPLKK